MDEAELAAAAKELDGPTDGIDTVRSLLASSHAIDADVVVVPKGEHVSIAGEALADAFRRGQSVLPRAKQDLGSAERASGKDDDVSGDDEVRGIERLRAYTEALDGLLPVEPGLVVGQPTAIDPSRAPAGQHVLWVQVRVLPSRIRGDAAGTISGTDWDQVKDTYADRVVGITGRYAPGFSTTILGRAVHSPPGPDPRGDWPAPRPPSSLRWAGSG